MIKEIVIVRYVNFCVVGYLRKTLVHSVTGRERLTRTRLIRGTT